MGLSKSSGTEWHQSLGSGVAPATKMAKCCNASWAKARYQRLVQGVESWPLAGVFRAGLGTWTTSFTGEGPYQLTPQGSFQWISRPGYCPGSSLRGEHDWLISDGTG